MSIIEALRCFCLGFPELKDGALLVDYLGSTAIEHTVETVPCDPIYRRYTDGGCLKQFLFMFASREGYSRDVDQCIQNMEFYEHFERWIREKNEEGDLPDLGDDRRPVSLEVLTGGYAFSEDATTARYQMQLRLIYEEI